MDGYNGNGFNCTGKIFIGLAAVEKVN